MTTKKAIEILKRVDELECKFEGYTTALDIAVQALEKQLPKKPIVKPYFYGKKYYCSECQHYICAEYNTKEFYCSRCGQALDWSDENV